MSRRLRFAGVMVAALVLMTAPGCASTSPEAAAQKNDTVYKSPQEVFDAMKQAAKKNDMLAFTRCLDDDIVDLQALTFTVGALMHSGEMIIAANTEQNRAAQKKLLELMAQHGLTQEVWKKLNADRAFGEKIGNPRANPRDPVFQKFFEAVKDRPAYLIALKNFANENKWGPGPDPDLGKDFENLHLADVKVNGEKATGIVVGKEEGQEEKRPIEFRRINGSWKIRFPGIQRLPQKEPPQEKDRTSATAAPVPATLAFTPDPTVAWSCAPGWKACAT